MLQQLADVAATDVAHLALGARLERLLHARVDHIHGPEEAAPAGERVDSEALNDAERAAVAYADALLRPEDSAPIDGMLRDLASHYDKSAVRDMTAVVLRAGMQHQLRIAQLEGSDPEPADLGPAEHHAAMDSDQAHGMGSIICPQCGHELSLFMETPESRANRSAQRLADALASWRFIALLSLVAVLYVVIVLAIPLGTDTAIAINYLGIGMTTLVALQTPLILLTQRRDAARDRARDQEILRVATHTEYDLHALRNALEGPRD
ncbi:DUF1003 domain-containing protein [Aeromicrobium sp. CF3.5]|uniref:DUF1003 domain-containing protein n=1 Tax=Aeromicrobium sp. CF3.5 TaxID=3373078 RepID=UPI003EE48A36